MEPNDDCSVDADCPGSERCVTSNQTWLDNAPICACSYMYGHTGDKCNEFTAATMIIIVMLVICVVFSTYALTLEVMVFVKKLTRKQKLNIKSASFQTLCFVTLGTMLFLIYGIIRIYALTNGDEFLLQDGEDKYLVYSDVTEMVIVIAGGFVQISGFYITVYWLEISIKTEKLQKSGTNIKTYRNTVHGLATLYIVLMVFAMAIRRRDLAVMLGLPFNILTLVLFYVSHRKMDRLLGSAPSSSTSAYIRGEIRKTTRRAVVLLLVALFVTLPAAVVEISWKSRGFYPEPGTTAIPSIGIHIIPMLQPFLIITYTLYLDPDATSHGKGSSTGDSRDKTSALKSQRWPHGQQAVAASNPESTIKSTPQVS